MRAWRTSGGTLVDEGPGEVSIVSPLSEEVPEGPWREHRRYVLFDGQGDVRSRYYDSVWSVEDELGASLHAIIDGTLRELTVTVITFGNWTTGRRETTVLEDLREIGAGDAESWRWIRAAFAAEKAKADAAVPLPAALREGVRALCGTLEQLRKDLLKVAEEQDWADASRNASAYREAAGHVAAALKRLQ